MEEGRPAPKKSQDNTVFISYAREDSYAAKRLRKDLKDAGLNPWLDKEEILPGQNWQNQIEDAISKSRYFIPLFSKTSVAKIGYVQSEFKDTYDILSLEGERPAPNKSQENTVFISYAREDSDAAKRLQQDLKVAGLTPWLDKESLIGGRNMKISIKNAIKKSRFVIPLFSSISVEKRGYVQREFKYVIDVLAEFPESKIYVIPCRLDDCEIPYDRLKDIEYIDLFPDWDDGLRRIIQSVTSENNNYGRETLKHEVMRPPPNIQTGVQPLPAATHPILKYGSLIVRKSKHYEQSGMFRNSTYFVEILNTTPNSSAKNCRGSITLSGSSIINRSRVWEKDYQITIDIGHREFLHLFEVSVFRDENGIESTRLYFSHPLSLVVVDEISRNTYDESLDKKLSVMIQSDNANFPTETESFKKSIRQIILDAVEG